MTQVVPVLQQLDRLYGSEAEPYCHDIRETRHAQDMLAQLVAELVARQPSALRRVCAPRDLAERLSEVHGVRRVNGLLPVPSRINQTELDPAAVA
jgi:hypothetical protein